MFLQNFAELSINYEQNAHKLEECEKALEELGCNLSESKLKIIEMQEELLPLSDAQWENDANVENCKRCNIQFSVSKRRHHCRKCGSIFCNSCSSARLKLPSNAKPVRVCLPCYNYLQNRQNCVPNE
ncbi:unnamed protein product [Dracunculus medinensis]|uniref:FYVE-type domain-containing protein n=1 Tax=Dracunculus medinensis TaxID=318479 RepID=A0A0N4U3G9_DRAME|nr:unnamed protein product [Dracunculus medinensis]